MIQSVKVIDGCISCRNCETVCPSVFKVDPKSKVITDDFTGKDAGILQAEAMCPVNVIKVDQQGGAKIAFKTAVLQNKSWLTDDILELTFLAENFSAKPGQYISLRLSDAYGDFSRSYSLAEYSKNHFTLTVKILKKGRGGKALKKLKAGKKCKYLGALGVFTLKNTKRPKVCIATGTGLAPMMPILRSADKDVKKILMFGSRYEHDLYYFPKLSDIENFETLIRVSRPDEKCKYNAGHVTDDLSKIPDDAEVYISGNPAMVEEVSKKLGESAKSRNLSIYKEAFTDSSNYKGKFDYHIIQGNIPYTKHISWGIILFSLFGVIPAWMYMQSQGNIFASLGPIDNFMGFLYNLSWWSVVFVMAIRPLSDIFSSIGILRTLKYFRKPLGILSASIIVVNWLGAWYFNPDAISRYFTAARFGIWLPLTARLSEWTALILLLTSNSFSQKFLGQWWKRVQRLSYIYFISGAVIAMGDFPYKYSIPLIIVGVLYAVATYKNHKK